MIASAGLNTLDVAKAMILYSLLSASFPDKCDSQTEWQQTGWAALFQSTVVQLWECIKEKCPRLIRPLKPSPSNNRFTMASSVQCLRSLSGRGSGSESIP